MSALAAEVIRDPAALPALAAAWAALWRRGGVWPFQHPAWLLPWWDQFGSGAARVAVLRDGAGALLGLLPLYDLIEERKILPMGAGLSDHHDVLLDPDAPDDAAGTLLREALSGCDWPCHLIDLPPDATLRRTAAPCGWRQAEHAGERCPVLRAGDVPARQRRKLRMARHRAERVGGCAVLEAATLLDDLIRLQAQRWPGRTGVLADPRVRDFHGAALPLLAEAGLLRLRGLYFGEVVAAVIYALRGASRWCLYLSGFDAGRAFESPGTILLGAMIDEAAAEGATELHFLRGAEAYKYAWGATDRRNATMVLERA